MIIPRYISKRDVIPVKNFYYDIVGKTKLNIYAYYINKNKVRIVVKNIKNSTRDYKLILKFGINIKYVVLSNINSNEYEFTTDLDFDVEPVDTDEEVKIPKKIYQTYKSANVSKKMYRAVMTIVDDNPEYEYYFYSDEDCRKYILKNFGKEVLNLFDNLIPGAFKADLFRYCILSIEGGVYMDIDFKSVTPLREIVKNYDIVIVKDIPTFPFREDYINSIFQAFIATVSNNEMIKKILEQCITNLKNRFLGEDPLDITGPNMVGKVIMENFFPNKDRLTVGEYSEYNMRLLWHKTDSIMDEDNRKIIHTKFEGYNNSSDNYAQHYLNGGVYKDVSSKTPLYITLIPNLYFVILTIAFFAFVMFIMYLNNRL